jgi:hypothetical protein
MTAMSCECWLQVKDKRDSSNLKRYRAQLGLCYGGPLIITLMTLIVEFGAARCSAIRPKFAEESCFFAGKFIFKYRFIHLGCPQMFNIFDTPSPCLQMSAIK